MKRLAAAAVVVLALDAALICAWDIRNTYVNWIRPLLDQETP